MTWKWATSFCSTFYDFIKATQRESEIQYQSIWTQQQQKKRQPITKPPRKRTIPKIRSNRLATRRKVFRKTFFAGLLARDQPGHTAVQVAFPNRCSRDMRKTFEKGGTQKKTWWYNFLFCWVVPSPGGSAWFGQAGRREEIKTGEPENLGHLVLSRASSCAVLGRDVAGVLGFCDERSSKQ